MGPPLGTDGPTPEFDLHYDRLRELKHELKAGFDDNLAVRAHRCISWVGRAESAEEDYDSAFIFLWIAFNSIYSAERFYRSAISEKDLFADFFRTIVELDHDQWVYNAIWDRFPNSIRTLLNNQYVFQPFWESVNKGNRNWEKLFEGANRQTLRAFQRKDTLKVLSRLFDRLYVLRNQLTHGGATWNSSLNRSQVTDGARILQFLVPILVHIIMMHPGIPWSKPYYPVLRD